MKKQLANLTTVLGSLAVALCFAAMPQAHANLTLELDLIHNVQAGVYTCAPNLSGDGADATPVTYDEVYSPHTDSMGQTNFTGGFGSGDATNTRDDHSDSDFPAFIQSVTGVWTLITDVGAPSQHVYTFTVSAPSLTTNPFINPEVDFPSAGQILSSATPTILFHGPTNTDSLSFYVADSQFTFSTYEPFSPAVTDTSVTLTQPLTNGDFNVNLDYSKDMSAFISITTPQDTAHQSPAGWTGTSKFDIGNGIGFSVDVQSNPGSLVAHYTFDDNNNIGHDSSGNGYDLDFNGDPQGGGVVTDPDSEAGANAAYFDGGSFLSYTATPAKVLSALAGDLSVSVWIKTGESLDDDGDPSFEGAGIVEADRPGQFYDIIPMALTGGEIAFGTGPDDDTLSSDFDINDNFMYHHVVITRDRTTGEKEIYIDGSQDNSDFDNTAVLNDPVIMAIGAKIDASVSDPSTAQTENFYQGLMDDLQIYSRVLTADEVTFLYQNPGSEIPGSQSISAAIGEAVGATNLNWSTSGDANWFVENDVTFDGSAAVQSGSLQDSQTSVLETTVDGPGVISFYWKTIANDDAFVLDFFIDGEFQDEIAFNTDWQIDNLPILGSGPHTLTWQAATFNDNNSSPDDAGFLDEVVFSSQLPPNITAQPFDQTNYTGYNVCLLVQVDAVPAPTFQWYKNNTLINGATNNLYLPPDAGTNTVAGNYYATINSGMYTANTRTAAVTFVSAPVPPDWTTAFKSVFDSGGNLTRDFYYGCILDASGNIYTAAEFSNTNTSGSQTNIAGTGGDAAAIVKQAADGTPIWVQTITNSGNGHAFAYGVATAPGDGVYFSGNFGGSNLLGTRPVNDTGHGSVFLARFTSAGSLVWVKTLQGDDTDFTELNLLTSDPSGNVTISGLFAGTVNFGGGHTITAVGQQFFIVQYDSTGTIRWVNVAPDFLTHIVYNSGRIYFSMLNPSTNYTYGSVTVNTDRRFAVGALDNATGQAIWLQTFGADLNSGNPGGSLDDAPRVSVSSANVFVVGRAYGSSAVFGANNIPLIGGAGDYFARYDTNGTLQLSTSFGSETTTPIATVADAAGNVYVSGDFDTFSFFGQDELAAERHSLNYPSGFGEGFVAKFDRNGNSLWARRAVSDMSFNNFYTSIVNCLGIALGPNGDVWASGYFNQRSHFGTNAIQSNPLILEGGAGGSLTILSYEAGFLARISDIQSSISPVVLTNLNLTGTSFQFSFISTPGHTNIVQSTTNLTNHSWQNYTNVLGDGGMKTITVPGNTGIGQRFFRVATP